MGGSGSARRDVAVALSPTYCPAGARRDSTRIGTIPTATIVSEGSAASARRSSFAKQIRLRGERVEVERPQHERRRQLLHHVHEHQQQRGGAAAREQRHVHAAQHLPRASTRGFARRRPSPA